MTPHRHFHRLAWAAVALAISVSIFGAFVRLSDAGLSCPDWPTCYGRAAWPTQAEAIALANERFERPVEVAKAWREQVHRHIAALLGFMVLGLAALAVRKHRLGLVSVFGSSALVAVAIPVYMGGWYVSSSALVAAAQLWLVWFAIRSRHDHLAWVGTITLAVIIVQAMLGMWTVTWLLKPAVVMAHLLGGLTMVSLLTWMAWRSTPGAELPRADAYQLRPWIGFGLALLGLQIALGGWTSANYAALACGTDFPTCQGQWWPETDFSEAFVLWRGIGVDFEGGVLDGAARAAIHLSHRIMAVLLAVYLFVLAWRLFRIPGLGGWGVALAAGVLVQWLLGIGNVVMGLPLWMATLHTAGAIALLFILVSLWARLRPA